LVADGIFKEGRGVDEEMQEVTCNLLKDHWLYTWETGRKIE